MAIIKKNQGSKPVAALRKQAAKSPPSRELSTECVIPPALPHDALPNLMLRRDLEGERAIREYMRVAAADERVTHAERVAREHVLGRTIDAWDVLTDRGHWWVMTEPTNLYPRELFPSLDYVFSLHVGVTARLLSRPDAGIEPAEKQPLAAAWRRWEQAAELVAEAQEAEDMQSIGMRCRESLIAMVKAVATPAMVPSGMESPQTANVVQWCGLIADHVAHGGSAEHVRGYLKSASKSGWQLVNWLTHTSSATRPDAMLAVDITQHMLATFGTAIFRHAHGIPDRCPSCGSYQVGLRRAFEGERGAFPACQVCDWHADYESEQERQE